MYAQKIEGDSWEGEKLDPVKVAKMNGESKHSLLNDFMRILTTADQQVGQLYELMVAIRKHRNNEGEDPNEGKESS